MGQPARRGASLMFLGPAGIKPSRSKPMCDESNVELLPIVELTIDELEAVSGSEADFTTFFQVLSSTLRSISEMQSAVIAKINV
jgi:hypothetical protein